MPDREHSVAKNAAPFTFSCFPSTYFLSSFYFLPAVVLQAKVSHGVRRMENGPGGVASMTAPAGALSGRDQVPTELIHEAHDSAAPSQTPPHYLTARCF